MEFQSTDSYSQHICRCICTCSSPLCQEAVSLWILYQQHGITILLLKRQKDGLFNPFTLARRLSKLQALIVDLPYTTFCRDKVMLIPQPKFFLQRLTHTPLEHKLLPFLASGTSTYLKFASQLHGPPWHLLSTVPLVWLQNQMPSSGGQGYNHSLVSGSRESFIPPPVTSISVTWSGIHMDIHLIKKKWLLTL